MAAPPVSGAMADVLALLLQAWESETELPGWLIMKAVRRSGPTVYKVLDRLEDAEWITGSWEVLPPDERRPRRRFYRLTPSGVEAARAHATVPAAPPSRPLRPQPGFGFRAVPAPAG